MAPISQINIIHKNVPAGIDDPFRQLQLFHRLSKSSETTHVIHVIYRDIIDSHEKNDTRMFPVYMRVYSTLIHSSNPI